MSDTTIKNQIPVQTAQISTSTQTAPAVQPAPVNETAFDAGQTGAPAETSNAAGMDTFVPSSNASVEELTAQSEAVQANNAALKESEASTQNTIDTYTTRVENQENYIGKLTEENTNLKAEISALQNGLTAKYADLRALNSKIADLNSQIKSAEGFVGGFINGVKNATGLFGGGVDINALNQQLAAAKKSKTELLASIKADSDAIKEKGGSVQDNNESIERTENYKQQNEDIIAQQEAELAKIQEMYKNGEISEAQIQAALDEAYKAAAEEKGSSEKPSAEQQQGTAAAVTDILENGELNINSMDAIKDGVAAQDTSTGEFNAEAFRPAYEQAGFNPDEIGARVEIIEAIANYAEIGLDFDPMMLESANVIQLDAMVETAIVQDVMKSTSTKFVGKAANFTSKKEMQEYSDTVDECISAFYEFQGYYTTDYQTSGNKNVEADALMSYGGDMVNKMGQGYVYGTSEVQELTNNTAIMMTTLKTMASSDEVAGKSSNAEFEESKHKTEDAINFAEGKLQGQEDDNKDTIGEFRTEFLNLTSKFNHSDSDSAKQVNINAMNMLYERALNAEDGINKDPFRNGLNVAA